MTLDLTTHKLYVAAADYQPAPPAPNGKPGRPQMVPGSFRVMVYSRSAASGNQRLVPPKGDTGAQDDCPGGGRAGVRVRR